MALLVERSDRSCFGLVENGRRPLGDLRALELARGERRLVSRERRSSGFEMALDRRGQVRGEATRGRRWCLGAAETGVEPLSRNVGARHPTARFHLDGGEFVLAGSSPRGEGRSSISLTWGRMPDGSRVAEIKATLREWLARVG